MERVMGLEPTTLCLEGRCSSQLSYTRKFFLKAWVLYKKSSPCQNFFSLFYSLRLILPLWMIFPSIRRKIFSGTCLMEIFFFVLVTSIYTGVSCIFWISSSCSLSEKIYPRKKAHRRLRLQSKGVISFCFIDVRYKYEKEALQPSSVQLLQGQG